MSAPVRLVSADAEACVAPGGGEPVAWRTGGADLLWPGDAAHWPRSSPVLFPIVGHLAGGRFVADGRSYRPGVHGFARDAEFAVVGCRADRLHLRLVDSPATRALYPFAFRLDIRYRLTPRRFTIAFEVANTGRRAMPYALGFHPGFRWPFSGGARAGHRVVFARPERAAVPQITAEGLIGAVRRPVPLAGRVLPLADRLLDGEALCFLDAASRSLRFVAPDGAAIAMAVEDFPHLALWSRPGAPFLCMEAWTGHSDPAGFAGTLADKPSMRWLAPGAAARHAVRLAYRPADAAGAGA